MNFQTTEKLIAVADKYIKCDNYTIKTEGHKNYRGIDYTADYVEIINDPNNSVSFEVTENEIIIFFFSDHVHFSDYGLDVEKDEPDYIDRAIEFLENLFNFPIERKYTVRGDKVVRDESFFILSETKKESCAGVCLCFAGIKNLFKKKGKIVEVKKFDVATENFTTVIE